MTDPALLSWLDQEDARVADYIRRYGWSIEYVGGACSRPGCGCGGASKRTTKTARTAAKTKPPFAYTIGLFGLGHPELLILGVPPDTAMGVLNDLGARVMAGAQLVPGQLITFAHWPHRIVPEGVPNPGQIVFAANRHYQRPPRHSVPVLQLSYDDKAGRFPWEPGYSAPEMQPRPGAFRA